MASTTHSARITGPMTYRAGDGRDQKIPLGPCLVEQDGGPLAHIVWGASGQKSAALPAGSIASAEEDGRLVMLD